MSFTYLSANFNGTMRKQRVQEGGLGWSPSLKPSSDRPLQLLFKSEWERIRTIVLNRDGHKCRKCGSTKNLDVHHIVPLRTFPHSNNPLNLVALCDKHHKFYENKFKKLGWTRDIKDLVLENIRSERN
jgi:hypothetical protein